MSTSSAPKVASKPKVANEPNKVPSTGNAPTTVAFADLDLCDESLRALHEVKGYRNATEVQDAVLPHIMAGKDVLARAKTGSGKTIAFLLPVLEKLKRTPPERRGGISALVEICRRTRAVDVLETASAAIANCVCRNDSNGLRLGRADGIELLLDLTHTETAADIADTSLIEDVQANAAEALANLTRMDSTETAERLRRRGVAPIVRMCASSNAMVRTFAPLVIGNVAQNDHNRLSLGCAGAIEAVFLLAETPDRDVQRNAMWALSNLAWAPDNQERIGCFMGQLVRLCRSKWEPVQANALVALANSLFFHDGNRRRLGHMPGVLQRIASLVRHSSTFTVSSFLCIHCVSNHRPLIRAIASFILTRLRQRRHRRCKSTRCVLWRRARIQTRVRCCSERPDSSICWCKLFKIRSAKGQMTLKPALA